MVGFVAILLSLFILFMEVFSLLLIGAPRHLWQISAVDPDPLEQITFVSYVFLQYVSVTNNLLVLDLVMDT